MKALIKQISDEIKYSYENHILTAVQNVGFDIDKERLEKALVDSRSFYNEGYEDARQKYESNMKDFSCIVLCAFRYALGRMSYMPSLVAEFIKGNVDKLTPCHIRLMIEEINDYDAMGWLGMDCDIQLWLNLKRFLEEELGGRNEDY